MFLAMGRLSWSWIAASTAGTTLTPCIGSTYKSITGKDDAGYVKDFIAEIGTGKDSYEAYDENHDLYAFSKTITWDYEQKRPYKGDVLKDERRMYLHLYYNPESGWRMKRR